jgi:uncharacterized protein YqjF (DUF2071 family)
MPLRPWVMTQTWNDLLFVHWPLDPYHVAPTIPPPFVLDVFAGFAWIGIVAFHMTNVALRGTPSVPWVSAFPELNVRTYVRYGDRPGVFFFSLDAGNAVIVRAARLLLNLPYYFASMHVESRGSRVAYRSMRRNESPAAFSATYAPASVMPYSPVAGTLNYFLTERYCLYHVSRKGVPYRLDIHHAPWQLQSAEADIEGNTMAAANGFPSWKEPPLLHFSKRQDMVGWAPEPLK